MAANAFERLGGDIILGSLTLGGTGAALGATGLAADGMSHIGPLSDIKILPDVLHTVTIGEFLHGTSDVLYACAVAGGIIATIGLITGGGFLGLGLAGRAIGKTLR